MKKTSKYAIFILMIAIIPYLGYFTEGDVPLTSNDAQYFYSFYSYHHNQFKNGGITSWNPCFGLGADSISFDPSYNPFRLPNLVAYLFPEPMQGWVFLLIIQLFLVGYLSFKYFTFLDIKNEIAFICSVIYMMTPLHDEFLYQSFWGWIMILCPAILMLLHKYQGGRVNASRCIWYLTIILSTGYLSIGALGIYYLVFGSAVRACTAAPRPRPPQPTRPTRKISLLVEAA